ncbi:MAG: hypothetical protein CMJ58_01070 [Planctomycetaceae bacterium]|nr:hypothetical protein [Planctomycetaceae bacterium]
MTATNLIAAEPIDRRAVVTRHNVVHRSADAKHFLQVGNGEFAFAMDVTGLQTLDREFEPAIPLHTMSNWGWHRFPNDGSYRYEQTLSEFEVGGRTITYADRQKSPAGEYFRANPHRVNLARIGLWWEGQDADGSADLAAFTEIEQELDLWSGCVTSRYKFRGEPVTVQTVADPRMDAVAFRIQSPLLESGQLGVAVRFSYPAGEWGPAADDFSQPDAHATQLHDSGADVAAFSRTLDDFKYSVLAVGDKQSVESIGQHAWRITWPGAESADIAFRFSTPETVNKGATFDVARSRAAAHWKEFWRSGGAIDLGAVDDPRAREIERRVVLSQYLTAIQNGSLPPQETGLLCNSWFGKQHLEMHWWHAAHFPLWGRPEILARSMDWYRQITPQARRIAERQGYDGVRWPKMCGPDGISSPSGVGEFLVWQQPHVIWLAESLYRTAPTAETRAEYAELVDQTARFMADFAVADEHGNYHLPAPLIPAQECYRPRETRDPTFELAYWHWALSTAQQWRTRAGLPREQQWDRVIDHLAHPAVRSGQYAAVAVDPFTNWHDHPSMLCALGVLPRTPLIDPAIMRATADSVEEDWDWQSTWGWDYPVMAMTRARCGQPELAVAALLRDSPKNGYLPNGHNYQEPRLPIYLPGNGGTLTAVAMMAAGWEGAPDRPAPGFPADWPVRFEGLAPMP